MHFNGGMKISNLSFAAGPDGLFPAVARLEEALGSSFKDGGFHPRFGTRNHILPTLHDKYIEVVEVLEHPAAEKAPFGQAVRARTELGGGWMAWVIETEDIAALERRIGRSAMPGSRQFPDGRRLEWRQIGVRGHLSDPQLPFFIQWDSAPDIRPSALAPADVEILEIEISGNRHRVAEWLGFDPGPVFDGVALKFGSPNGQPGIESVTFRCPKGIVRI